MARTRAAATARRAGTARSPVPRRVSGPIRPGHPRPVTAVPPRVNVTAPATAGGRDALGAVGRLRALPDHRFLDTLLRSRAWIWLMGIALGGIVAMQVSLLKMNAGIGTAVQKSSELEHANATLEEQVAELSSGQRIADAAGRVGLVIPDAGSVGYLTVRPRIDARRAARNMVAPSDAAKQLMASNGLPAGAVAPVVGTTTAGTPATTTGTTATTTAAAAPTAVPTAAATVAPTVAPTTAPVATATPQTTLQTAGATTAPGQ